MENITLMDLIISSLKNVITPETEVLFIIFIIILGLEMTSGILKAIKNKNVDSTKFREGLLSKSGYILQVLLVVLISIMINMPYLLYADLLWLSCSEGISVLENLDQLGIKLPIFVKNILEKTKDTTEKEMDDKESE